MPRSLDGGNGAVIGRIVARRRSMPTAMARIAELVISMPSTPVELSITDLAERAGTSPATVTRFCRTLGFDGYTQFRVAIASELGRGGPDGSWRTDIGTEFGPTDSPDKVLRTLLNLHVVSLETTAASIDLAAVGRVAQAIADSRHIDLYGVGGSAVVATELQRRLHRVGLNAHAWSDTHDGLASAALQDESCVAIGISNTGQTDQTVQMLMQAKAAGALAVAVTHDDASWIADVADISLTTAEPVAYLRPDDMSVRHTQYLVIDLLYLLVAQQMFDQAAANLAATALAVSAHRRPRNPAARPTLSQGA